MLIAPKRLKLRTSNLTHVFPGTGRHSPDVTPKNFQKKGAWPRSRDPLNFWALNANSSKKVTATDFKFDARVPGDSPDMTPKKFYPKGGVATVT